MGEHKVRILYFWHLFENLASLEVPVEAGVEAVKAQAPGYQNRGLKNSPLIKKENFPLYIRKFRMEQLLSHI